MTESRLGSTLIHFVSYHDKLTGSFKNCNLYMIVINRIYSCAIRGNDSCTNCRGHCFYLMLGLNYTTWNTLLIMYVFARSCLHSHPKYIEGNKDKSDFWLLCLFALFLFKIKLTWISMESKYQPEIKITIVIQ